VRARAGLFAAAVLVGCGAGRVAEDPDGPPAAAPPILAVRVASPMQRSGARATAFAVGHGRVVTVAHVLDGGAAVFAGGRRARIVRADPRLDLAVLGIRGVRAARPRGASAQAGEHVTVRVIRAGTARSMPAEVRRTITARMSRAGDPVRVRPALELAAAVIPGDSGAPVLDGRGRVVGMIFAQASDRPAVAYALDARGLGLMKPGR
jgi:S1-C subfamily serine protease